MISVDYKIYKEMKFQVYLGIGSNNEKKVMIYSIKLIIIFMRIYE